LCTKLDGARYINGKITYSEYLEDQFKRWFSSYALAVNKQQNRHGTLFQKRFKRISVKSEYRMCYLLAYIHHNPIHHRLAKDYDEWKYSSWAAYNNLDSPSSLNRITPLSWFDKDIERAKSSFFQYHDVFKLEKKLELEGIDHDFHVC
jgi:putative transposase